MYNVVYHKHVSMWSHSSKPLIGFKDVREWVKFAQLSLLYVGTDRDSRAVESHFLGNLEHISNAEAGGARRSGFAFIRACWRNTYLSCYEES